MDDRKKLVITRRTGESLWIGSDVRVTILERRKIAGGKEVRLLIEAPVDILVRRDELSALGIEHSADAGGRKTDTKLFRRE